MAGFFPLAGSRSIGMIYFILLMLLLILALASLHLGVRQNTLPEVWRALWGEGTDNTSLIIRTLRLPRTLMAPTVGMSLGIAGLLLQTVSRNPLASPALLGVNAGAAFTVVFSASVLGISALWHLSILSFLGALGTTSLVFFVSSSASNSFTPTTTLLAGIAITALLASGTQIILTTDEVTMENLLFWLSGSFTGHGSNNILALASIILVICLAIAFMFRRALDALMTNDASAHALGVNVRQIRFTMLTLTALLTSICVLLAGPIAFIGLIAPHLVRRLVGLSHSRTIPLTVLVGANLALAADIAARFIIYPSDAPISAVLAFVGVPTLILLLQSHNRVTDS